MLANDNRSAVASRGATHLETKTTASNLGRTATQDRAAVELERAKKVICKAEVPVRMTVQGNDARSKLEARKLQRADRATHLKELVNSKPDEQYEDPRDLQAIRLAATQMGDYKLKSSPKYIVPESERVNAEKKKKQFFMLKDSIQMLKDQFNGFLLQLRERKMILVKDIGTLNRQVASIDEEMAQLGAPASKPIWQPEMEASAFPENRYIVTERDVDRYQKDVVERAQRLKMGDEDPLGGFNTGRAKAIKDAAMAAAAEAARPDDKPDAVEPYQAELVSVAMATPFCRQFVDHHGVNLKEGVRNVDGKSCSLSDMEIKELEARKTILQYRKERILKVSG